MIFIPKFAGQHGPGWDMGSSTFCVTRPWWPSRLMARFMQKFVFGIWWWSRNHGQLYNVRHFPQGVPHPAKIRGFMAGYELTMVMFDTFVEQPEIVQSFATNIHSDPRPNSPGSLFTKKIVDFGPPTILINFAGSLWRTYCSQLCKDESHESPTKYFMALLRPGVPNSCRKVCFAAGDTFFLGGVFLGSMISSVISTSHQDSSDSCQ